jgi:hypothetical protein
LGGIGEAVEGLAYLAGWRPKPKPLEPWKSAVLTAFSPIRWSQKEGRFLTPFEPETKEPTDVR